MKLCIQAILKFLMGILLVGVLIFVPAGTLRFANGWLLMGVLFAPVLALGVVLFVKNPALLAARLNGKEKQREQDLVVKLSGLMFVAGFVLAGLTHRFGWYRLPMGVCVGAVVVLLAAYGMYAEVLRENAYLSRTVQVQAGQTVVDTGLYGIVRHPMYSATLILFLAMPLVLGSLYAFAVFLLYPLLIVRRIRQEERLLERELDGYRAYQQKVRYRLIPFVW